MAMSTSNPRSLNGEPNVTPLIDVLLVLLIIFMVIVPMEPRGLEATLPQQTKTNHEIQTRAIVVQILTGSAGPIYKINEEGVKGKAQLASQLNQIYSIRADKILFVKGDPTLDFESVAEVIDMSRALGIDHVGILTPGLEAN